MADYLALVNKAIEEGGSELDLLTLVNWDSIEAGRRQYPRYKRAVAEAWKLIQMERNEWEFKTEEMTVIVNPRIKFTNGQASVAAPAPGDEFVALQSGVVLTIVSVELGAGSPSFTAGGAFGQIEFTVDETGQALVKGETIESVLLGGTDSFVFQEKGSYNFFGDYDGKREPLWSTFVVGQGTSYPIPLMYVPWENWTYKTYAFTGTNQSTPTYFSQDPIGNLVFYPQPLTSFELNFWFDSEPQALILPTDVPNELPGEYHEWIAWRALMTVAHFDKNPDLYAFAEDKVRFYKNRAERNLLPIPAWEDSRFNRGTLP